MLASTVARYCAQGLNTKVSTSTKMSNTVSPVQSTRRYTQQGGDSAAKEKQNSATQNKSKLSEVSPKLNKVFDRMKSRPPPPRTNPILDKIIKEETEALGNQSKLSVSGLMEKKISGMEANGRRSDVGLGWDSVIPTPQQHLNADYAKIIQFSRDRKSSDIIAMWRAMENLKPMPVPPVNVLQAVLRAFLYTIPDWLRMATICDLMAQQAPIKDPQILRVAVRAYFAAGRLDEVTKLWDRIQSEKIAISFDKPLYEVQFFRMVLDAFAGLRQFDRAGEVFDVAMDRCQAHPEFASILVIGAMNAAVDSGHPQTAVDIFNHAVSDMQLRVDKALAAALRRAQVPLIEGRAAKANADAELLAPFFEKEYATPELRFEEAFKAFEAKLAAGDSWTPTSTVYIALLELISKCALQSNPTLLQRAEKLYTELRQSPEFDQEPVTPTSFYMEILMNAKEDAKLDELYSEQLQQPSTYIVPATYDRLLEYYVHTKKDAPRALQIWHDLIERSMLLSYDSFKLAFDIYDELNLVEEAEELTHILKNGSRGIVVARLATERALNLALRNKDVAKITQCAQQVILSYLEAKNGQADQLPALKQAREFLIQNGKSGELPIDAALKSTPVDIPSQISPNTIVDGDNYSHVTKQFIKYSKVEN